MSDAIKITEAAAQHITNFLKKHNTKFMRLSTDEKGCSGLKRNITAVNEIDDNDEKFEKDGAIVIVSKKDLLYYAGTELDYVKEGLNGKLVFNNPLWQNVCGCGESFNLKNSG